MIRLWSWALDNAPDGDLSHLSARAISYGAGWRGSSDTLLHGLLNVGWLNPDHTIHDWQEYAGRLIERREKDAERKRAERKSAAVPQDVQGMSNGTAAGVRRTGPNRTGPDLNRTGPTTSPLPPPPAEGERKPRRRRSTGDGAIRGEDADVAPPPEVPLSPLAPEDLGIWARARERLRSALSAPNWELLVEPLEPVGRSPGGGLFLRAPPDLGIAARIRTAAAKALVDEGEPVEMAKGLTIVEEAVR